MRETRKPCELGHLDCIGVSSKDTRCFMDPSRCERTASGKRGRHEYNEGACIRCGKAAPIQEFDLDPGEKPYRWANDMRVKGGKVR